MTQLNGSTVLVTGAASGVGRLLVLDALARGARIVAWDVDDVGLKGLRDEVTATGADGVFQVVDVTDRTAVYAAAAQAGPIDVLILNAGVVAGRRFLDLPDEAVERVMAVNVLALFWCTKAFLPDMVRRNRGHVVTIASLAGVTPLPGLTEYVASKHAAYGFAESLRTELADDAPGVRTTVVLPQVMDTGMFEGVKTPRLFPLLQPRDASRRILDAVERDWQRLLLDRHTLLTAYANRALPPRVSDWLSRSLGAFDGMATFHGRSVARDSAPRH